MTEWLVVAINSNYDVRYDRYMYIYTYMYMFVYNHNTRKSIIHTVQHSLVLLLLEVLVHGCRLWHFHGCHGVNVKTEYLGAVKTNDKTLRSMTPC